MDHSRRSFLTIAGVGTTAALLGTASGTGAGAGRASNERVHEVVSLTDPVPENVAFDWNGDLYVGITGGSVRRLPAHRTGETGLTVDDTHLVAEYPGGVAGVLVVDGTLYTAVNGETGGVYALDLRAEGAEPTELATLVAGGQQGFVNDLHAFGSRLLVTESLGGVVHEVPLGSGDCEPSVWAGDDLLDTPSFGANGITAVGGDVFVTVTRVTDETGRIVRIPVECDGSAGDAEVYVEGPAVFGADGLTARGRELYVALNAQNRIAVVKEGDGGGDDENGTGDGTGAGRRLRTVVAGDPLSFPSEVVFDPTDPETAFVCNFSNPAPEHGGVLRTHVPASVGDARDGR